MISREQRRQAWDAGIAAGTTHALTGAQIASPWGRGSRLTWYFAEAARRAQAALVAVMEQRP